LAAPEELVVAETGQRLGESWPGPMAGT
jgi:hypothetical protein